MKFYQIAITFLIGAIAVSGVFASVEAASAPPVRSEVQNLRWKDRTIKLAISSSLIRPSSNIKTDSDVMKALRRSLAAWQSVADIEFELEPSDKQNVSPSGVVGDGVSLITIAQTAENVLLFSNHPFAESAKTRVFYNRKGFITEADIILNPFQQFSGDGTFGTFDLEATLTHEIGHLLGLRHSAVLSATMSDTLSRNGTFGFADLGPRTLAESDIAAIRDLYGAYSDDDTCCGAVIGKLTLPLGKPAKELRVWVEESKTGIVVGQADTAPDGSFRMGGLAANDYNVFWQSTTDIPGVQMGELGSVTLEKDVIVTLNEKINLRASLLAINYIGVDSQLASSSVSVEAGREYTIYVGGNNLDRRSTNFSFGSPFFSILPDTLTTHEFGDGLSVLSFVLRVDKGAPSGDYSIFANDDGKARVSLIGALNIE